jgi:hypothetical protein
MASYSKFNKFTHHLLDGAHDFDAHVFKIMLTNTTPIDTNTIKANITEISAGNGYTAGGTASAMTTSSLAGAAMLTGTDVTFTASGGSIGPFRYAVLYNDTQTTPAKPLIAWWDYGSSITLATTETFTIDFDGTGGIFTVV